MSNTLIIGGASSGKSVFAENYAHERSQCPLYVATMQKHIGSKPDEELQERIRKHQRRRGDNWNLIEEPIDIAHTIQSYHHQHDAILVDCLTLWITNLLLANHSPTHWFQELESALLTQRDCNIILVSNELGQGTIPMDKDTRLFRQYQGELNQRLGRVCETVYFITAGIASTLKSHTDIS